MARADGAVTVFAGEMQAIHDLLYRPQQAPDEDVLEAILAGLARDMKELAELVECFPDSVPRSTTFKANLRTIRALASEICGERVSREYAPELREWMDRIQDEARRIA